MTIFLSYLLLGSKSCWY